MALEYFLYNTNYNNTLVERSNNTFAPLPPNTGEILIDFFIPEIQPLYLYRESGGTIVYNNEETVLEYIHETSPPPTTEDSVTYGVFTGTTAILSATTNNLQANKVNVSGDTMTGTLSTSSNLYANGAISGLTLFGGSCVTSPILSASTCLCSMGTTRLVGATTAASTLNVSGITTLGNTLYLGSVSTGGTLSDYNIVWNPISNEVRAIPVSGGTANVYCYIDKRTQQDNTTDVDATYLTATWSLPSGYYEYEYGAIYGNDTSNRCAIICFLFDGVVVGSCNLMKTNDTNVRTSAYITQNNSLIGGNHTVAMVFRQCGGGTSSVYSGTIRIQKIGV